MDTRVEKALADIINRFGMEVLQNPRQLEGLLRDFCGDAKKEINLLIFSLKEGIPTELQREKDRIQAELLSNRLVKRLVDHLGLEEPAARWVVFCWRSVLGIEETKNSPTDTLQSEANSGKIVLLESLKENITSYPEIIEHDNTIDESRDPNNPSKIKTNYLLMTTFFINGDLASAKRYATEVYQLRPHDIAVLTILKSDKAF